MKQFNPFLKAISLAILLLGFCNALMAQLDNPLETDPSVWNSRELMVIWGQQNTQNDIEVKQEIYGVDYIDYLQAGSSPFVTRVAEQTIPTSVLDPGIRPMAVQSGDYDGDGEDEVVYAVSEPYHIKISAPGISKVQNADSTFSIQLQIPNDYVEVNTNVSASSTPGRGIPLLTKGDFDGDGQDEFALAARNSGGGIIVQLIDMDGGNTPHLRANTHDETSVLDGSGAEAFDICSGDFDGDGDDEIAIILLKENTTGSGMYMVFLRIYDVTGTGCNNITQRAASIVDDQLILPMVNEGTLFASVKVAVQSIKDTESGPDKLLAAFAFSPNEGSNQSNYFMRFLDVNSNMSEITTLDSVDGNMPLFSPQSLDIKCGDLNGDGRDNAVLMVGNDFRVYSENNNLLTLETVSHEADFQSESSEYETDNFEIADIDKNGRQNILYSLTERNYPAEGDRRLSIKSVELNPDFSSGTIIDHEVMLAPNYSSDQLYFGITAGNFDGDDLRLGTPVEYNCIYRRPMFILAPPPIHFDNIDGVNYDESGCFTGNDCLFYASNTMEESSTSTLTFTEKSDWNVSATVSAGYEGLYASVDASMTAKYGQQFANEIDSSNHQSITIQNTVTVDDLIKGVKYPVKVYEYPVYNAHGDLINYVSAAFPQYQDYQEYEEQGKIDPNYIPYYEPGNLLSYPQIGSADDFDDYAPGSLIYQGSTYTMSNNQGQSSTADITMTQVYGTNGTQSWDAGVSTGLSASGFGMGFEVNGEYNTGELEVNSTEMSGTEGFRIRYDNIGGPSGFNAYSVKPYIFWTKEGSGMLAYQVNLASSVSSPTWWDIHYGSHPDPALMLPQRNEVHYTTGADPDNPIFTRSKSMTFNRLYPNVGDEVTVECRVHNFSLMATSGPVKVSFYNGNPDAGGELMEDLNGQTIFETPSAIPARGRSTVSMTFSMPLPVIPGENFVRFYAVLDPQNEYEEVHEDNNMGWQTLGYDCTDQSGTNSILEYYSKERFSEMWVWPNPAADKVNLAFNMATSSDATLEIFDMEGKLVLSKNLGRIPSGEQKLTIDLPDVSPGLYFLQLKSKGFRKTHKLLIQ